LIIFQFWINILNSAKLHIKIVLILLIALFFTQEIFAQNGKITVTSNPDLDELIEITAQKNKAANLLDGYRIQIFSGSDRDMANAMKSKFLSFHPDIHTYLIYQQPYFKVRIGDFRNKLEAQPIYNKILNEFEQVLILPDKINFPKLD